MNENEWQKVWNDESTDIASMVICDTSDKIRAERDDMKTSNIQLHMFMAQTKIFHTHIAQHQTPIKNLSNVLKLG